MRPTIAALLLALPAAALAQTPAQAPAPAPGGGAGRTISRDQFIQRASNRAAQVFDQVDVNHTGSITADQLRAWRQSHAPQRQP